MLGKPDLLLEVSSDHKLTTNIHFYTCKKLAQPFKRQEIGSCIELAPPRSFYLPSCGHLQMSLHLNNPSILLRALKLYFFLLSCLVAMEIVDFSRRTAISASHTLLLCNGTAAKQSQVSLLSIQCNCFTVVGKG